MRYHTDTTNSFADKLKNALHSRDISCALSFNGSGTPVLTVRDADGTKYHITINRARDQRDRK
jgi:hypothetical protein